MAEVRKGMVEKVESQLEDLSISNALFMHCITLHQTH